MNRKSIFMAGINAKRGFSFTIKDCREIESVIDWYEEQLQQKDKTIDECIKYIEDNMSYTEIEKFVSIGTFKKVNEDILDEKMCKELLERLKQAKNIKGDE